MPGPSSAFQSVNNFGYRFYPKEKSTAWPLLLSIESVTKVVNRLKRTTWTRHQDVFLDSICCISNSKTDSKKIRIILQNQLQINFNPLGKDCGLAKATNRNVNMHRRKVTYVYITNEVMAGQFVLCIFQICMYFVQQLCLIL